VAFDKGTPIEPQLPCGNPRNVTIVGHHQHGDVEFPIKPLQQVLNLLTGGRIQAACRFIGDHDFGMSHNRPSDANTLLLAPRELPRIVASSIA
jgi:hypothetical protein